MSDTVILPEPAGPEPEPGGRRSTVIAAITAGTLAVVGAGAFVAFQVLGGGPPAEQALPAESTLAVVSLDLDPSAKQKVEALRTLQRFPSLRKSLQVSTGDDLRKWFFDTTLKDGACKKLDYDADIKPWIGENVALAAASFEKGRVSPLLALAVTDKDKAARGLGELAACAKTQHTTGWAFNGDFVLVSDSTAHAEKAVAQARSHALSDDPAYQQWSGKVGDRGILNFYVARQAATAVGEASGGLGDLGLFGALPGADAQASGYPSDFPGDLPSDLASEAASAVPSAFPTDSTSGTPGLSSGTAVPGTLSGGPGRSAPRGRAAQVDAARRALADFTGAAGALRFADGGVELRVVGGFSKVTDDRRIGDVVGALPSDTAAVLGVALPKDFAARLTSALSGFDGLFGSGTDLRQAVEDNLGITLPADLQTLLGDGVSLSVPGTPPADMARAQQDPRKLPAGLVLKGDPAAVKAVLSKIEQKLDTTLADEGVTLAAGSDRVVLSFDADYAKALLGGGDLRDDATFRTVVPEADKARAVGYLNFDSAWRDAIGKTLDGTQARDFLANTEPLQAFGLSTWTSGSDGHLLLKLTTD